MTTQIIGVDVSKRKLHAAWLRERAREKFKSKATANSAAGVAELLAWTERQTGAPREQLHFILEASNVYHEAPAEQLLEAGAQVSVVNPAHARYFAKSRGTHAKSDAHDRRALALFGFERRPRLWQPLPPEAKELRAMLRRAQALEQDLQRERNRLESAQYDAHTEVLHSHHTLIDSLEREIERLRREINDHIDRHPELREKRELLESIPGVGEKLSAQLCALFAAWHFVNARQAAAFLGLIPRPYQSGDTVWAPARLTKAGDARLRTQLYYPAITAVRYNPLVRALYQRLRAAGKPKMAAIAAAMRKLVHIAFGVVKNRTPFQHNMA